MADAGKEVALELVSADLVMTMIQLSQETHDELDLRLKSGGVLSVPIIGNEMLSFTTAKGLQEVTTPMFNLPSGSRLLTIFWLNSAALHGSYQKNPTHFPNMSMREIHISAGSREIVERLDFNPKQERTAVAYLNSFNNSGGTLNKCFVGRQVFERAQSIYIFDISGSQIFGPCLEMAPNPPNSSLKTFSIRYLMDKAPTENHSLMVMVEKEQMLRVQPDYTLTLNEE